MTLRDFSRQVHQSSSSGLNRPSVESSVSSASSSIVSGKRGRDRRREQHRPRIKHDGASVGERHRNAGSVSREQFEISHKAAVPCFVAPAFADGPPQTVLYCAVADDGTGSIAGREFGEQHARFKLEVQDTAKKHGVADTPYCQTLPPALLRNMEDRRLPCGPRRSSCPTASAPRRYETPSAWRKGTRTALLNGRSFPMRGGTWRTRGFSPRAVLCPVIDRRNQ